MQPPAERERQLGGEEGRGGSKIYGVTNYWQQLVLSRLPTTWISFLSLVSTKFHLLPSLRYLNQNLQLQIYGAFSSFDLETKRAGEI